MVKPYICPPEHIFERIAGYRNREILVFHRSLPDIWKRPMKNEYFPVTITSYALEYMLWGANVRFYHLTTLIIIACIGFAARSVAIRLAEGGSTGIDSNNISLLAGTATILMLCHPLNVESRAAISNRKELSESSSCSS